MLGIDLGTCNSCIAKFNPAANAAQVIANKITGRLTTPSSVTYDENGKIICAGEESKLTYASSHNTVGSFKRLIGRRFDSAEVQEQIRRVNYGIVRKPDGFSQIQLEGAQKIKLTPENVSRDFIREFLKQVDIKPEEFKTVLTVPAYFTHQQKLMTERAGTDAGLNLRRLIAEPTAAALQFNQQTKKLDKHELIMVVDLGAGTFDVSLLEKNDDLYQVLAAAGNNFYGGDDYTQAVRKAARAKGVELSFVEAEKVKHALGDPGVNKATLPISNIDVSTDFDALDRKLEQPIARVLTDAQIRPEQVTRVLLVGGQTKQKSVQNAIQKIMRQQPLQSLNPDACVAQGAAVQAAVLDHSLNSVLLLDVTPFSLGIETLGGQFSRVLNRNVTLPAKMSQVFTTARDNQSEVKIRVFQGEHALAEQNLLLGEFDLVDIPPAPRGQPRIQVSFEIDQNGVVNVSAVDLKTGRQQGMQVRFGEQRVAPKSEAQILKELLERNGVRLTGKEDVSKLRALKKKLERRGKEIK